MPIATYFYPRIVYSSGPAITIDFDDPVTAVTVTPGQAIRGENTSVAGVSETISVRDEYTVRLVFTEVPTAKVSEVYSFWTQWGRLRKQAAITLDRLATCGDQWEYDNFNTYFTKAELLTNPFMPQRARLTRARYNFELLFRQGT
jgi:hypothetical protein